MIYRLLINFGYSILTGVVASISFAIILYIIQRMRYWYKLKRKFDNKTFRTYWKNFSTKEENVIHEVECRVKRNIITFKGKRLSDNESFEGEFIINPINLKMGEGIHYHKNYDGFAFPKIIIKKDKTILVEATFIKIANQNNNVSGTIIPQAFVWKMVE